jgi:hypothetical protein
MRLYHFTSRFHLDSILRDGVITTTESNVGSPIPFLRPYGTHVGPDVVWLLDLPDAGHTHGLGHEKTEVRIAVEVPAIRWLDWPHTAQMNPKWFARLVKTGGGIEAAAHWYVFPAPIRASSWEAIHVKEPTWREYYIRARQQRP